MKDKRQRMVLDVIMSGDIETQGELIKALEKRGISCTQATVSRDIKELGLQKEMTKSGTYRYTAGGRSDIPDHFPRLVAIFKESVTSYGNAQNIVVIRTLPGLAPAACSVIDNMGIESLVGTIAGDDTGFLAMSNVSEAERFCNEIARMLK